MNDLQILMILVSTSTLLGYIASRHLKTQPSVMILLASLVCIASIRVIEAYLGPISFVTDATIWVSSTNFNEILLDLMLPILLFAGAASLQSSIVKAKSAEIATFASISTLISFVMVSYGFHAVTTFLNTPVPWVYSLLFGALISPTDPVAVIGMLKHAKASPEIEAKIAGESLFNDGIGIVIFLSIYELAFQSTGADPSINSALILFAREFLGGLSLGVISGYACRKILLLENNDAHTNILISLFVVCGIYTFGNLIHVSGPIAVVMCGMLISDHLTDHAQTKHSLETFWGTMEEILNMLLYLLIGLEALQFDLTTSKALLACSTIALVLLARIVSFIAPTRTILRHKQISNHAEKVLIWGGLRGGLAIALALSIPEGAYTESVLLCTYAVVCFTNLVQGGTIGKLLKYNL